MATTSAREQQLEQRIAELEHTAAQLIRATAAAVNTLGHDLGHHGTTHLQSLVMCGASQAGAESLRQFLNAHPGG